MTYAWPRLPGVLGWVRAESAGTGCVPPRAGEASPGCGRVARETCSGLLLTVWPHRPAPTRSQSTLPPWAPFRAHVRRGVPLPQPSKQKRKFSSFFKSLVIELDKDTPYGPDNHQGGGKKGPDPPAPRTGHRPLSERT